MDHDIHRLAVRTVVVILIDIQLRFGDQGALIQIGKIRKFQVGLCFPFCAVAAYKDIVGEVAAVIIGLAR